MDCRCIDFEHNPFHNHVCYGQKVFSSTVLWAMILETPEFAGLLKLSRRTKPSQRLSAPHVLSLSLVLDETALAPMEQDGLRNFFVASVEFPRLSILWKRVSCKDEQQPDWRRRRPPSRRCSCFEQLRHHIGVGVSLLFSSQCLEQQPRRHWRPTRVRRTETEPRRASAWVPAATHTLTPGSVTTRLVMRA